MPLSEDDRTRTRHHMGYIQVGEAYTFVLGSPASLETTFVIEGAMDRLLERAIPRYRKILDVLDKIEEQMVGDLENLAVTGIGDININLREQKQLTGRYDYWVASLANMLGVPRNPFDKRLGASNTLNVGVVG